jgi:hypothetical protein
MNETVNEVMRHYRKTKCGTCRTVLDALVQANAQEDDEDASDEAYERRLDAKTLLFLLANEWKSYLNSPPDMIDLAPR